MLCKEIMNLRDGIKKNSGGNRPPQPFDFAQVRLAGSMPRYQSATQSALTELTVMVLSFSVPVTVTFVPACLSRVARAALSLASSV